ncbi:MAG: type II toxin-antitoxin system mRNA interferase toxin, RelE/StbE family [Patescibacteria group bacterium]|nr:type II toxin-antitoxin system mRNA interferase toxin, RelE/StbE family [Patescibacteria group bacterium]
MKIHIKKIVFDASFERDFKKYKKRLSDKKIERLKEKLLIFKKDPFNQKLKTHKLKGNLKNYWSFSVSYFDRILFRFLDNETVFFIDIGNHDIYG